jgi:Flp pilus assembly protein TadB
LLAGETAINETNSQAHDTKRGQSMAVLWFLVALLIIFAIVGGVAVNNWLFLILLIALVLLLVGAF